MFDDPMRSLLARLRDAREDYRDGAINWEERWYLVLFGTLHPRGQTRLRIRSALIRAWRRMTGWWLDITCTEPVMWVERMLHRVRAIPARLRGRCRTCGEPLDAPDVRCIAMCYGCFEYGVDGTRK